MEVYSAYDIIYGMACPERRVVLAGESPVRVSAGAPGSRLQPGGEIRPSQAECRKPLQQRGANQRAQQSVNAIASTDYRVWESRAAHVTAKAKDNILGPERMLELSGGPGGGTLRQNSTEQERPYLAAESGKTEHI